MTTIINSSAAADFAKTENTAGQPACFTALERAAFAQVPIGVNSPLFKLAVLISRCFVRLFGAASLVPDLVEEADPGYPVSWPCCS